VKVEVIMTTPIENKRKEEEKGRLKARWAKLKIMINSSIK
jgi:hypothetical protein